MTRIRYLLLVLFGVLALIPVAVFGLWSSADVVRNEFKSVEGRHLLLARNLSASLRRYHHDLVSVFEVITDNLTEGQAAGNADALLTYLNVLNLCIADSTSGVIRASALIPGNGCPAAFSKEQLWLFNETVVIGKASLTGVLPREDAPGNIMYLVRWVGEDLGVATVTTDFFVNLGNSVSFGEQGHATIVDHKGNVLAHPDLDWVIERRSIAGISAVRHMLNGETGIGEFFSPALQGDMIAGYTMVEGPRWGVMVPQPVQELFQKAAGSQKTALMILLASVAVAASLSVWISILVSRPIEKVMAAFGSAGEGREPTQVDIDYSVFVPDELIKLQESFNGMVRTLHLGQEHVRRLAYTDSVTALPNRESFQQLAMRHIEHLTKTHGQGAMIMVDVDEFKTVNDTLGHDSGDQVLRALADRLAYAVEKATGVKPINRHPEEDFGKVQTSSLPVIGRVGGDEFLIFVPNLNKHLRLDRVLKHIQKELSRPLPDIAGNVGFGEFKGGASVGAAIFPTHGKDYDTLVKLADIAMYHAKRNGKNRSEVFRSEIGDVTVAEMRRDVSRGLQAGELLLHYQPKVNAKTGVVEGVEALVRWNHPERGLLSPGTFIPMIEEADVVIELGEWVLYQASQQVVMWQESGLDLNIAVNIASRHFGSKGFAKRANEIVTTAGALPNQIGLEITEETVLSSMNSAHTIIVALRKSGFKISLDDFGRGYSNLTRLANLEVDIIKIDGPLSAGVTVDKRARVIVSSTIEMAHGLGCSIVAEGVETVDQASVLRKLGCEELQGYYFARPMAADVLNVWLDDRQNNQVQGLQEQLAKINIGRKKA